MPRTQRRELAVCRDPRTAAHRSPAQGGDGGHARGCEQQIHADECDAGVNDTVIGCDDADSDNNHEFGRPCDED